MPIILPLNDAGEGTEELFTYERVWASLCSIDVLASADIVPPSFLAFELEGEISPAGIGGHTVRGQAPAVVRGSVDNGQVPDNMGYGSMDVGQWSPADESLGSIETTGEGVSPAIAALTIGMYPSLAGYIAYLAAASLETRSGQYDTSLSSLAARNRSAVPSRATASVRGLADAPARGTLETGTQTGKAAQSSLVTGNLSESSAIGATDAVDGEGLAFIVDIQDEILGTGGGE